jgi:hypothetical protein
MYGARIFHQKSWLQRQVEEQQRKNIIYSINQIR